MSDPAPPPDAPELRAAPEPTPAEAKTCTTVDCGTHMETRWCDRMRWMLDVGSHSFRVGISINKATGNFCENVVIDLGANNFSFARFCPFCAAPIFHDDARPRAETPAPPDTRRKPSRRYTP